MKQPLRCYLRTWIVFYIGGRARARAGFRATPNEHHLDTAVQLRSALTALQITIQPRWPRLQTYSRELYFTMENALKPDPQPSHRRVSTHGRREPLCARKCKLFFAIPTTSKHHLDTAVPLRSAITALQITLQLRRPRLQTYPSSSHCSAICACELYLTMQDAPEREPGPSHRLGSPHGRREPLCAKKHKFSCDSKHPNITWTTTIYNHCLANHTTSAWTKAATHNKDAAILCDQLNSTLRWRTRLSTNERRPNPWHRQGSPHRRREPFCARKHRAWCDSYI